MSDDYLLVTVSASREHAEPVEDTLLELGALSVTYADAQDQPIHEPAPGTTPLWPQLQITGMFAVSAEPELLSRLLQDATGVVDASQIRYKTLQGRHWERAWMDDYQPIAVNDKLWIVPSFCDAPDLSATNISIDPGLAFGSGTHATTWLCLQWLGRQQLSNKVVIDYGCGSGILAVGAALLGAAHVYAYDIDAQALLATQENAERNTVADKITVCHADRDLPAAADMVVANILLAPLLDLHKRFAGLLPDHGRIGLSGVLAEQVATLAGRYAEYFQHEETELRQQWALYSAKRLDELAT
ncbi:MAG: 50S ribosomal protein L11 methyltransferase [Pseudomonadota bacterium]